ncbi:unnamed protein product [Brugia timori]|uniref:Ovule protein n=1 Tax=Brugia timori TaxID=42155 RepID=A0A0R3QPU7_9BILA|nr:unnamed protein product [Brugia timori]
MSNPGHSESLCDGATFQDGNNINSSDGGRISSQNTSFNIASSKVDMTMGIGNDQLLMHGVITAIGKHTMSALLKSPRDHHYQKRKSSLFNDSFREKKPALSGKYNHALPFLFIALR